MQTEETQDGEDMESDPHHHHHTPAMSTSRPLELNKSLQPLQATTQPTECTSKRPQTTSKNFEITYRQPETTSQPIETTSRLRQPETTSPQLQQSQSTLRSVHQTRGGPVDLSCALDITANNGTTCTLQHRPPRTKRPPHHHTTILPQHPRHTRPLASPPLPRDSPLLTNTTTITATTAPVATTTIIPRPSPELWYSRSLFVCLAVLLSIIMLPGGVLGNNNRLIQTRGVGGREAVGQGEALGQGEAWRQGGGRKRWRKGVGGERQIKSYNLRDTKADYLVSHTSNLHRS
ncbi:hypothetical protein Pmani_019602 [Petrolisthes manimaculis]|uniref:Uncharacterized protein n=1 Tax=Petrolisthes manimaculis TaxID=1843537 RepID=A0AAE1PJ94_9EUCA|nr:hypothetical protein Pmani_019602 [Petrolisthes manimaculis]